MLRWSPAHRGQWRRKERDIGMKWLLAFVGLLTIASTAGCCNRPGLFNQSYYGNYAQPTYTNPCACPPTTVSQPLQAYPQPVLQGQPVVQGQ